MKYQVIASAVNRPGKKDASGAFVPCAQKHAEYLRKQGNDVTLTLLDLVNGALSAKDILPGDALVFYGHGTTRGLQTGHYYGSGMARLARQLNEKGVKELALYACSFMGGQAVDTFMDKWSGTRLFGHTTAGHCAYNPFVAWRFRDKDGLVHYHYDFSMLTKAMGPRRKALRKHLISGKMPFAELPKLDGDTLLERLNNLQEDK
jgi:hypothetical protein